MTESMHQIHEEDIAGVEAAVRREKKSGAMEDGTKHVRVRYGIYSMRGEPGCYVVRIRLPAGRVSSDQLDTVAELLDRYGTGRAHFTTRQGIQIAGVSGEKVGAVLRKIEGAGMTTRKTGGNVVRGVVCCPLSGVSRDEFFDVTPYALAVDRYLSEHPDYQSFPRKVKIAFEGCTADHVRTVVSDIGLSAKECKGRKGFHIRVGGGLGILPVAAQPLEDFTPIDSLLPALEAVLRVFDRNGNRSQRGQARLKWLIRARGIEWFREAVFSERERIVSENGRCRLQPMDVYEKPPSTKSADSSLTGNETSLSEKFQEWKSFSLYPQKQEGFYTAMIKCPLGDLNSAQIRRVSTAARQYGVGSVRATIEQNIALRWLTGAVIPDFYDFLSKEGLVDCCAEQIADITRCVGAEACISAITNSAGAVRALAPLFANGLKNESAVRHLRIRVSGCQNACSHTPMADIGLVGIAKRFYGKTVPHYSIRLGGSEKGELSHRLTDVPARRIADAVKSILDFYANERITGENFRVFVQRRGIPDLKASLKHFTAVPSPEESPDFYRDLDSTGDFKLEVQEGECHA